MHGPRYLFALVSAACCTCTALVIFAVSFRPPVSPARPFLSFRSLFGRLLRSERPSSSFRSLFVRLLRLHGPRYLFVIFSDLLGPSWVSCCRSWVLLAHFVPLLGLSWPLLGRSWEPLGRLLAALGPLLGALGRLLGGSWRLLGSLSIRSLFGRLLRLHGPRYLLAAFSAACSALNGPRHLFVLFSSACFAWTALVTFSFSFRTSWAPLGSVFAALGPS